MRFVKSSSDGPLPTTRLLLLSRAFALAGHLWRAQGAVLRGEGRNAGPFFRDCGDGGKWPPEAGYRFDCLQDRGASALRRTGMVGAKSLGEVGRAAPRRRYANARVRAVRYSAFRRGRFGLGCAQSERGVAHSAKRRDGSDPRQGTRERSAGSYIGPCRDLSQRWALRSMEGIPITFRRGATGQVPGTRSSIY